MKNFIIFLFLGFLINSCKKEDTVINIPDDLLLVKKIEWPTMTGSDMFIKASYIDGKLLELKRGVNGFWYDSVFCFYSGKILDSAIYYNRFGNNNADSFVLEIYPHYTDNNITMLVKYDQTEQIAIDTFYFTYSNNYLIAINSQNENIKVTQRFGENIIILLI